MRFKVLTVPLMNIQIFRGVMLCESAKLHRQGTKFQNTGIFRQMSIAKMFGRTENFW
jgi:hypothetical protein